MYLSLKQFTVSTFISLDPFVSIKLQNINFYWLCPRQWIKLKIADSPRSTARSATFNHTLRHVQPHAPPRSTPHYVIRVNLAFAHDSSLPLTHQFRSPILLQLRSPILLTSAHRICSLPLANSQPATNERSRFNQRTHASTNEHSSLKFHTALVHVVSTTFCHSL